MSDCPSHDLLENYVAGVDLGEAASDLPQHIAQCERCSAWLNEAEADELLLRDVRRVAESEPRPIGRGSSGDHQIPLPASLLTAESEPPRQVGDFRIIRKIGEGGMGVVYQATQGMPRREVALKLIRTVGVSPGALKRFQRETDALGRLNHPGIAQIFDAGVVEIQGCSQPFFAMELVHGRRLDHHLVDAEITLGRRLELLAAICDAVHHAHQKGVIHRDLKPANILIDENGRPRILDFGVARLTDSSERPTRHSEPGNFVGTLPYMSPEQVSEDPLDLDIRTDVYSLGVIACQMLTGQLPYDLKGRSVPEAVRVIRERSPVILSDPSTHRRLPKDIETVIGKALEKAPNRRYGSVAELAADIRRFLHHEPIVARPASGLYLMGKFAQRNRALVGGAAIAFAGVIAGLAFAVYKAVEVTGQRNLAIVARAQAQRDAEKAERTTTFLQELLSAPAGASAGHFTTLREVLDRAALRVESELVDQPETAAQVRWTIGNAYMGINRWNEAESQFREFIHLSSELYGAQHERTVRGRTELAYALSLNGEFVEAEQILDDEIARHRGGESKDAEMLAVLLDRLAEVLFEKFDFTGAVTAAQQALSVCSDLMGERHPRTVEAFARLAYAYSIAGRRQESVGAYRRVLALQRDVLGAEHRDVAWTLYCLGFDLNRLGALDEAESLLQEAIEMQHRIFGERHVEIAHTLSALGDVRRDRGDYSDAEKHYLDSLEMRRQLLGNEHLHVAMQLANLARFQVARGRLDEAERNARDALAIRRDLRGGTHPQVAESMTLVAQILLETGRCEEAENLAREAIAIYESTNSTVSSRARCAITILETIARQTGETNPITDAPEQSESRKEDRR